MGMELAVRMRHIQKEFPGIVANQDVDFEVACGEIHGLIGENGAGKSTLMKVLYGLYQPDGGQIEINGRAVTIKSPLDAIHLGIGMVHQHFMLVPSLTVLDNIILGKTPTRFGLIDRKNAHAQIEELINQYGFRIDLDSRVYQLSVGQMQRVEIIKALYRGAKILILDEPTAVLTPSEIQELFAILKELAQQGCSIILITHKLKEVMAITDNVTVMRRGRVTGRVERSQTNEKQLAGMMVGREVVFQVNKDLVLSDQPMLEVEGVTAINDRGLIGLRNVSLSVHRGEVVGIAGVEGNGQTELINVVTGMKPLRKGRIVLNGKDIHHLSVQQRREHGVSHIPEDRLLMGVSPDCSIEENLIVNTYSDQKLSRYGFLNQQAVRGFCNNLVNKFNIKVARNTDPIRSLSGGNMQKVVVAREIDCQPKLLVAAQPTRGVDIVAIEFIHKQIINLRDSGSAILLVSAEIDEILALSDRIYVLYEGEIVGQFINKDIDEVELGMYMTGTKRLSEREVSKSQNEIFDKELP